MSIAKQPWRATAAGTILLGSILFGGSGCQTGVGGQALASPYATSDDVQYFAPGPEFKLSREAAAQKAYRAEQRLQQIGSAAAGP